MENKDEFIKEAKENGLTKQNKIIARKAIRVEMNKRITEIRNLRKMSHTDLSVYFGIRDQTIEQSMENRMFIKKCKNDRIIKLEKELEELEKDEQLLARCPTMPPMLWGTTKNHTNDEKKKIMNKYID